jgi:hypothetical protein
MDTMSRSAFLSVVLLEAAEQRGIFVRACAVVGSRVGAVLYRRLD